MIKWIKNWIEYFKEKRAIKRRLKELKERDPFIY